MKSRRKDLLDVIKNISPDKAPIVKMFKSKTFSMLQSLPWKWLVKKGYYTLESEQNYTTIIKDSIRELSLKNMLKKVL